MRESNPKVSKNGQTQTAHVVLLEDHSIENEQAFRWGAGFYDFSKPLQMMNNGQWSSVIEGRFDEGFFVLSPKDPYDPIS